MKLNQNLLWDVHILLNATFTDKSENAGPMQVHAWAFKNEK